MIGSSQLHPGDATHFYSQARRTQLACFYFGNIRLGALLSGTFNAFWVWRWANFNPSRSLVLTCIGAAIFLNDPYRAHCIIIDKLTPCARNRRGWFMQCFWLVMHIVQLARPPREGDNAHCTFDLSRCLRALRDWKGGGRATQWLILQTDATEPYVDLLRDGDAVPLVPLARISKANLIDIIAHPGGARDQIVVDNLSLFQVCGQFRCSRSITFLSYSLVYWRLIKDFQNNDFSLITDRIRHK
jgi:hypothetical protein